MIPGVGAGTPAEAEVWDVEEAVGAVVGGVARAADDTGAEVSGFACSVLELSTGAAGCAAGTWTACCGWVSLLEVGAAVGPAAVGTCGV